MSPGVLYEAYVQANCGVGGTSTWVGPIAFSVCNGTCADAVTAVIGVNTTGEIDCGNGASNAHPGGVGATNARWFSHTAPSDGIVTASACGAVNMGSNDTALPSIAVICGSLSVRIR
ncbi:MAG: hypothetical protein IPG69_02930 [Flavobacteriales bacterium]|nr:hypothetical protein [Flavobacteriales bacterium]